MQEAFSLLAADADLSAARDELRTKMHSYVEGITDQLATASRLVASLVANPEGVWIDGGGLASRTGVPTPPLTIAVGRDGVYYMTAGTERLTTQDISYVVSAQLQRAGARLSGTIMVGYYMRSTSERYACSSTGAIDMVLSQDGRLLTGTSALSRQPNSVPAPLALLCASLPSGTRTIGLTRQ